MYDWNWSMVLFGYELLWLNGLLTTLAYAVGTVVGGLVIGVLCGLGLLANRWWLTAPIHAYVELFRCTPVLVQIVWFFFALPIIIGVEIPAWLAAGIGLTLYMGCFATEIFRGGIISIDKGQWQAARAIGMTYGQMMRHIILPQAVRRMMPAFVNYLTELLKNSTLLSAIGVGELVYQASTAGAQTFRYMEFLSAIGIGFFLVIFPLSLYVRQTESRRSRTRR